MEFGGDGLRYLSCDARFAISNICAEFGALGAIVEPDQQRAAFVASRTDPMHRSNSKYYKPDEDAKYFEVRTVDLSSVLSYIAIHLSPDNVYFVGDKIGMGLDGCFIGPCTTTEEDLIIGALVIKTAMENGLVPRDKDERRVTPGSLAIVANSNQLGLMECMMV